MFSSTIYIYKNISLICDNSVTTQNVWCFVLDTVLDFTKCLWLLTCIILSADWVTVQYTPSAVFSSTIYIYIAHLRQQCHNSKCAIFFQERLLKVLKCYNFLWAWWRHKGSPAASVADRVMTSYLLKSASANVYFYNNNSKMPNSEFWHSCRKSAIYYIYFKTGLSARLWATKAIYIVPTARYDWIQINRFFSKHNTQSCT